MTLFGNFIYIKRSVNDYSSSVLLITLSSLLGSSELFYLYSSSLSSSFFYIQIIHRIFVLITWIICRIIMFSFYFIWKMCIIKNGLYPVGNFATNGGRIGFCWVIILVLSWFGIGSFIGVKIAGDFILFFLEFVFLE